MKVPLVANTWVMVSGLVPVSITWRTLPAGSLMVKMKSVEPPGIPLTIARYCTPASPVNGIEATGCAAVISPVLFASRGPKAAVAVEPIPAVPFMVACALRW